jgi:hypothetical protein
MGANAMTGQLRHPQQITQLFEQYNESIRTAQAAFQREAAASTSTHPSIIPLDSTYRQPPSPTQPQSAAVANDSAASPATSAKTSDVTPSPSFLSPSATEASSSMASAASTEGVSVPKSYAAVASESI